VGVVAESDDPERFRPGAVLLTAGAEPRALTVMGVRRHHGKLIVRFAGVDDRTAAEALRNTVLTIEAAARRPLADDEFWPEDLVGLEVVRPDGSPLGRVRRVVLGAAQDRLVVDTGAVDVEVPFVAALVPEVDVARGRVVVDPPHGLF
jgi:16S rRNA processing protein RimM